MDNNIFNLPDDFHIGQADTMIYFYTNDKPLVRNKIVFTKNMVCLLQHGVKYVETATGKETITNNDLMLLTSGGVLMSENLAENNQYEAILLFFGNDTLADFCAKRGAMAPAKTAAPPVLRITRDAFLNHFCESLKLLRAASHTAMDEWKVQELLGYIATAYPDTFQHLLARALGDTVKIRLKQVVELHAREGLTIEELAFLCNMSVSTFKRRFAETYQMPPQKYFTQVKMEQAKTMLSAHKRPSDIYHELGYENLSAFSNEFKKYHGVSPSQFRQENEPLAKMIDLPA